MSEIERRRTPRFGITLPVTLRSAAPQERHAITRDISSSGAYIYVEHSDLNAGASVEFVLELPPSVTLTTPVRVWCRANVVRVDPDANRVGVALQIESYEFMGDS